MPILAHTLQAICIAASAEINCKPSSYLL